MADRITDERLREIVVNGTYCGLDEGHSIAAELLAARAEVAAVDAAISDRGVAERDCRLPVAERIDNILVELKECGWQFGTAAMENERLCAEVERLRADLREALSLLRDSGDVRICDRCCENADTVKEAGKWEKKCDALLAKHKETP